jgi:hypothetical protein
MAGQEPSVYMHIPQLATHQNPDIASTGIGYAV